MGIGAGCVTTTLVPLCPQIARVSYSTMGEGRGKIVGRFVAEQAASRGVKIRPLSYVVAELSGPPKQIRWFRDHYTTLLCAFNPDLVKGHEKALKACFDHVGDWMRLVDERKDEQLTYNKTFCQYCQTQSNREEKAEINTIRLPLCPKLAEMSYDSIEEGRGKIIGRTVAEAASARKVRITPLSSFVADFTGPTEQIRWFKRNYPDLLCAFNPKLVVNVEATNLSCMNHVRQWMDLVASGKEEDLMLNEYLYCPNCCDTK
jgi:hypothetical protein